MQNEYPNKYLVNFYYRRSSTGMSMDPKLDFKKYTIKMDSDIIYSYEFKTSGLFAVSDLVNSELFQLGRDLCNLGEFYKIEILAG